MELISTKYSSIETDMQKMLIPLGNDQLFLRYVKYLSSDYPLEQEIFINGNLIQQPDIPMPYDLTKDKTILLTLLNQNIVKDAKIYMFFSHIDFNSNESRNSTITHRYIMDICIPYQNIQMDDKLRNARIANEIMEKLDNQYLTGTNKIFIRQGKDYILNNNFQGITLYISVENQRE